MNTQTLTVDSWVADIEEGFKELHAGERFKQEALRSIRVWLSEDEYRPYREQILDLTKRGEYRLLLDSFYQVIPFGTGGRRGPVGVGPNRINFQTIGESAQALANYLLDFKGANTKIKAVIAYDTRNYSGISSRDFAVRTAEVFAGNGIPTYIFEDIRSTPELSFAVRELQADIGVVISASHNPPTDNGFKAYWADGGQILPPHDQKIIDAVSQAQEIKQLPLDKAQAQRLVCWIGSEIDKKYLLAVREEALISEDLTSKADTNVHILYTPLHGTGITSVLPVLRSLGYRVDIVEEQSKPDGGFPGVKNNIPNPENPDTLELAIERAKELGADVVLASDPDADRLGVAVPLSRDKTKWIALTGNQIASLLTHFVLKKLREKNALPKDGLVVKTRVTTDLMMDICRSFGVSTIGDILVGFKYIAEIVDKDPKRFILGAEESHGFVKGSYTRDKDAAVAALLMAELTGDMKKEDKTPYQLLNDLYQEHGYYGDVVEFILLEGAEGRRQIEQIMDELRTNPPTEIGGLNVVEIHDYLSGTIREISSGKEQPLDLPESDFLVFTLSQDGRTRLATRPSGTEPKIKYYVSVYSKAAAKDDLEQTDALATAIVQDIIKKAEFIIAEELSIRYRDLHDIMQAFATPFDTGKVAEVVVSTAREMLKAEAAALFVKDEPKNRLSLLAQEGYGELDRETMFYDLKDDKYHITTWILSDEGQSVKIDFPDDFPQHQAYHNKFKGGKYSHTLSSGERSLIGIPLMLGNDPWAVLKVVNALEPKPHFNDGDRLTLEGLGQLYMTALENSHRMAQQTELTRKLIDFVGTKEQLYNEIVEECRKLVYAEASSLFLFDDARKYLWLRAASGYWGGNQGDYFYDKDEQRLTTWIAKHPTEMVKLDSLEELRAHPGYNKEGKFDAKIWKGGSKCHSFLGLALQGANNEVIGVLKVENKRRSNTDSESEDESLSEADESSGMYTPFNNNDAQLLRFISNIIVLAITHIP